MKVLQTLLCVALACILISQSADSKEDKKVKNPAGNEESDTKEEFSFIKDPEAREAMRRISQKLKGNDEARRAFEKALRSTRRGSSRSVLGWFAGAFSSAGCFIGLGGCNYGVTETTTTTTTTTAKPTRYIKKPDWCKTHCSCYHANKRCPIGSCPLASSSCAPPDSCPALCTMTQDALPTGKPSTDGQPPRTTSRGESAGPTGESQRQTDKKVTSEKPRFSYLATENGQTSSKRPKISDKDPKKSPSKRPEIQEGYLLYKNFLNMTAGQGLKSDKIDSAIEKFIPKDDPQFATDVRTVLKYYSDKPKKRGAHRMGQNGKVNIDVQDFKDIIGRLMQALNHEESNLDLDCPCSKSRCKAVLKSDSCGFRCAGNYGCPSFQCACPAERLS